MSVRIPSRHRKGLILVLVVASIVFSTGAMGQTHFAFTSNTGNNATVGIPASVNPTINGTPLASGDEIGAFTPAGLCVGATVWSGAATYITVWGDNDLTPAVDGIAGGEQISYRVWDQSTNTEYTSVSVSYSQGSGNYSANGIYVLASLSAAGPPTPPALASPSNGATGVSTAPTLTWNVSGGATSYQLQVSTNSSFSSTVVNQSGITGTSYGLTGLSNSTVYYWRVNATNASGTSSYSSAWSFTTAGLSSPPAPTLSSPSSGSTGVATNPTLSWNASTGATSYRLQVSTSAGFAVSVVNQSGITGTSYNVTGLSNGTLYYWRVNATNAGGTSAYSTSWNFTTVVAAPSAPTLSSPANGATGVSTSPALNWNASTGATSYQLEVSTNSSFSSTVVNQSGITGTSYGVTGLTNGTTYYWRVNATNAGGTSAYSTSWSFTTSGGGGGNPPAAPTLSSPVNGATGISTTPTLNWNASTGATSYQLQVSTNASFSSTVVNQSGITGTSYGVTGLTNGTTYYWRVNATNAGGTSAYSTSWSFTTSGGGGGNPPAAPTLASPSNGATGISASPTLSWNASSGATSYQLQVSSDFSFSTTDVDQSGITGTSYGITGLAEGATYYWRMNATNAAGTSSYSDIWSFTTTIMALAPAAAPALESPEDGATSVSADPTLSWDPAGSAISYQLQVSTTASFKTTVVNRGGILEPSIELSGLSRNTTHYWRVCANYGLETGPYSAVRSFTTVIASPVAPNLLSPIDGAVNVSTLATFVWEQSTGASSYQLQISTDPSFSTTVIDSSGITATSLTVRGLKVSTLYYWRVNASNVGGPGDWSIVRSMVTSSVAAVSNENGLPQEIRLFQNYPNPFNNSTIISYELPKSASVTIEIYSVLGQKVATLAQGVRQPGYHQVSWESSLSSGVYYYTLVIDGSKLPAKKMIYLR
jgi:hypothetical protein